MKKIAYLFLMTMLWSSCKDDDHAISSYEPVIMDRSDIDRSVTFLDARELDQTGKIYQRGHYLFISELYEGVHVINNTDPQHPINEGFIRVPGCVDIASKGDMLYVNSATDLLAIDLTDLSQVSITSRTNDMFPELTPPRSSSIPARYKSDKRPANSVIVNWVLPSNQ